MRHVGVWCILGPLALAFAAQAFAGPGRAFDPGGSPATSGRPVQFLVRPAHRPSPLEVTRPHEPVRPHSTSRGSPYGLQGSLAINSPIGQVTARARSILPVSSIDSTNFRIYIEKPKEDTLIICHNLTVLERLHIDIYPTCSDISTIQNFNLEDWIMDLVFGYNFVRDSDAHDLVRRAFLDGRIRIYVDRSTLVNATGINVDFGARAHIFIVDSLPIRLYPSSSNDGAPPTAGTPESTRQAIADLLDGAAGEGPRRSRRLPTFTSGIVIRTDTPPPIAAQLLSGCCLFGRPVGIDAQRARDALAQVQLRADELALISLVRDSATREAISRTSLHAATDPASPRGFTNVSELRPIFQAQRGKQIMVLGHVEGTDFVTRDGRGDELARFPVLDLRNLAEEFNVLLIEMGCNTAGVEAHSQAGGIGVASRLNTVDAISRISDALSSPELTLEQFLQKVSYVDMHVVVDASAIDRYYILQARYFHRADRSQKSTIVARINVTIGRPSLLDRIRQAFTMAR